MSSYSSTPAPDAAAEAEAKWLTEALLGRPDCNIFRQLKGLHSHIRATGVIPRFRSPPPDLAAQRSEVMYQVLQSMDQGDDSGHPRGFARNTAWFLNIGSKSDGFARYILEHPTRITRGVGVIPPVTEGGTGWAIPPGDRFELHQLDLFDLVTHYLRSRVLPFNRISFDFIILDLDPSSPRALVAQLLLALHVIVEGGSILLTLSCIEQPLTARATVALSRIADHVTCSTAPPKWGHRFYLHAQTVRKNSAYRQLKDRLETLWHRIQTPNPRDPTWDEQDLITPWQEVFEKPSIDLLVHLGNPLWKTQLTSLYRVFGTDTDQTD
ncbi:unnamed protein product [Rhizoctonia solani]|uniref:Ribosomal RNA methyltransferase FtsJ domain-containing protein n=1 Tax=Rhizoctonia solani TaxID=456999 RepID=A0A8H3HUU7_9AGAM|nr:unnamed protein product [Rhizoctonia solani]CAE6537558.1 unnamed protein product [Rhizoctonia solani]